MKRFLIIVVALILATGAFMQPATADVISTFNTGLEDWTGLGVQLAWDQNDGNPNPSLNSGDIDGQWAQIIAPVKFHGPWSSTGTVSADIKFKGTAAIAYPVAFAITDGNTTYQYMFTNPTNSWVTYTAALNSPSWTRLTNNNDWTNWNVPIGGETLSQVLQNITDFHIRTDYTSSTSIGTDNSGVDNVRASLAPLPASAMLLGSGLMGLGLFGWRRKQS
jgi:hypothetical protein